MKPKKVLFLEASGGGGHISITTAIIQALKKEHPQIETVRVDVMHRLAHKFYQMASRQFVNAFLLVYKATNNHQGEIFAQNLNRIINKKKLVKIILDTKPDLIFSNYSLAIDVIPKILEEKSIKIPFVVFVPDPFTVHSIYLSKKANMTMVSTLAACQTALDKGLSPVNLQITGHPVREEFHERPTDIKEHRRKLGLDPDLPTVLFGGSGHGAEKTLEILLYMGANPKKDFVKKIIRRANLDYKTYYRLFLKFFKRQNKNIPTFQAICVCGDNTELKEDLELLEYPSFIKPVIYLNSDNMAGLIHASDLVIGKAGPNILMESIVAGKPFLATYHIKGQEDGNIEFIRTSQLGFVEENPKNTARLIEDIMVNKSLLGYTKKGLDFAYTQNKDASVKIVENILKYLGA